MRLPFPPVLVITDRRQAPMPLEEVAAGLFAGGCRWLSLREKDLPPTERLALLRRLVAIGRSWDVRVMVHDDLQAASDTGVAGVHLPAGAVVREARRRLGDAAIIGQSAHNAAEIRLAAEEGADYVTLSPIFVTASKPGYGPVLGLTVLGGPQPLPVLALGGVDETNIAACLTAGAAGGAIMGNAMRAQDPKAYMAGLLEALGRQSCRPSGRRP